MVGEPGGRSYTRYSNGDTVWHAMMTWAHGRERYRMHVPDNCTDSWTRERPASTAWYGSRNRTVCFQGLQL